MKKLFLLLVMYIGSWFILIFPIFLFFLFLTLNQYSLIHAIALSVNTTIKNPIFIINNFFVIGIMNKLLVPQLKLNLSLIERIFIGILFIMMFSFSISISFLFNNDKLVINATEKVMESSIQQPEGLSTR